MSFFSIKILGRTTCTLALLVFFLGCGEKSDPSSQSNNPEELILSATEKQRIGAYDEAIEDLRQVLKLDPESVAAYNQMGGVYSEADQRNEAIDSFKKSLEMEPENLQARLGLGEVYSKMTRNDLAVAEFLKAESLQPNDTELLFKIALEYWYDQKLKEAEQYYQKILSINSDHMQTHLNLISVYEKLKSWEKAIEEIEISRRLGRETDNDQAIAIAERKLAFIKGRIDMTDKEYKRKTQPPFD
ncbi:MAG: tetratricopeptide repeat protein [Nitrospinae bacterium]|nr:tetratricopeptide repeat protein [Nitrospinota bacterium]MBL7020827.1 tetratricopeptide repeat protein [Nitrospinaceae bacterium]